MAFPEKLDKSAREYVFNKKESKRLRLIQIVKDKRGEMMKEKNQSKMGTSKSYMFQSTSKINELEQETELNTWKLKVDLELKKSLIGNSVDAKKNEVDMKKTKRNSDNSLKNSNSQRYIMEEEKKKKNMQNEKMKKELFLNDLQKRQREKERRLKEIQRRELEQKKLKDLNSRKIQDVITRAEVINFLNYERKEKKVAELYNKIYKFEKVERPKFFKEKSKYMNEYRVKYNLAQESIKEQEYQNRQKRQEIYERIVKDIKNHNKRALNHNKETSNTIRELLKTREDGVRNSQKILSEEREARGLELAERREQKAQTFKEKEDLNNMLRKYYSDVNVNMKVENENRLKQKRIYMEDSMRKSIQYKKEKIDEFEAKRMQEMRERSKQRQLNNMKQDRLREAYIYMAIWNAWDRNLIHDIALSDSEKYQIGNLMTEIIKNRNKNEFNKTCKSNSRLMTSTGSNNNNNFPKSGRTMYSTFGSH